MVGYAQSNARVSTLMRNIEASPWIGQPELVEIKSVPAPGIRGGDLRINEFTLNVQVKRQRPGRAESAPAPAAGAGGPAKPAAPAPAAKGAKA